MSLPTNHHSAFEPVFHALSDSWLQLRAKPILYLLLWISLSLAPFIILGQLFSQSIGAAITAFLENIEYMGASNGEGLNIPPEMTESVFQLIGFYSVIWIIVFLITIYFGAVLSGTIEQFRQHVLPSYTQSLKDGASRYVGFLLSVLVAVWKILWKPVVAVIIGSFLNIIFRHSFYSSVGFLIGIILAFSGLYRYGLSPFIHLHAGINGREACTVSHAFYMSYRPVVSSLFLISIFLPLFVILLLLSIFIRTGLYFGIGGIFLWLIQNFIQFIVIMTLINFSMNSFAHRDGTTGT